MLEIRGKPNPKALRLEGLEKLKNKVTVGFKCNPEIKLRLAMEAKKMGLTLSEYIETLIQQLDNAVLAEKQQIETLKRQLAFYENNDRLLKLFTDHKNQELPYTNSKVKK